MAQQSEAFLFFELFKQVRKEIANENGYIVGEETWNNLEVAIKKTFDKWNEWQKGMPEFDGKYLVMIEQKQECGNVLKYQKVVDCIFNNWVLIHNEKAVGWKKLLKQ